MAAAASSPSSASHLRRLLTVTDVAKLLQLSSRSVRRLIADGRLKVVRLGRTIRIRPEDLEVLMASSGREVSEND